MEKPLDPATSTNANDQDDSAGGLQALEPFLSHLTDDSGLVFIVIQHLDPTHKATLTELLQLLATIKNVQVIGRTQFKPNCIYVILPDKDMSILMWSCFSRTSTFVPLVAYRSANVTPKIPPPCPAQREESCTGTSLSDQFSSGGQYLLHRAPFFRNDCNLSLSIVGFAV